MTCPWSSRRVSEPLLMSCVCAWTIDAKLWSIQRQNSTVIDGRVLGLRFFRCTMALPWGLVVSEASTAVKGVAMGRRSWRVADRLWRIVARGTKHASWAATPIALQYPPIATTELAMQSCGTLGIPWGGIGTTGAGYGVGRRELTEDERSRLVQGASILVNRIVVTLQQQFVRDALLNPCWILSRHWPDQLTELFRNRWST